MEIVDVLTYLVGGVGIVSGLTGYYGKSRGDSIISYQAKEIISLTSYNTTLEKEKSALAAERDALKEQVETLTGLAQGSPELTRLTAEVINLTEAVTKQTNTVATLIKDKG